MDKKTRWHKEPMVWLLIALPLSAVIGGALTIWLAAHNADPLVSDDYYKVGMAPLQRTERDVKATALGLSAELQSQGGSLHVRLAGNLASPPQGLTLVLAHPSDATADVHLFLMPAAPGTYQGPLPDLPAGKRRLILEPTTGEWRLTGEWQAPFSGARQLAANQPNSSTSP